MFFSVSPFPSTRTPEPSNKPAHAVGYGDQVEDPRPAQHHFQQYIHARLRNIGHGSIEIGRISSKLPVAPASCGLYLTAGLHDPDDQSKHCGKHQEKHADMRPEQGDDQKGRKQKPNNHHFLNSERTRNTPNYPRAGAGSIGWNTNGDGDLAGPVAIQHRFAPSTHKAQAEAVHATVSAGLFV